MPFPKRHAFKDMHLRTILQILELWDYIYSYPACADLPILRAVMAEHRDFLRSLDTVKISDSTRLSITKQSLSAESFAHPPQLNFLRNRIFQVIGRIRDAWAAVVSRPHDVVLSSLQGSMACYDSLLSDLEGQQRLLAEDSVIHVKIKRQRSPSPQSSRKRHNGGEQSTDIFSNQVSRILRSQNFRDDVFRGLLAMTGRQINRHNAITRPREGELYFAYRKQSQRWLVALLLPHTSLAGPNAPRTLASLGLLKNLPEPFAFDADAQQLKWRDGYEDGGPLSSKQEFPVAFFAGPDFPDKSAVGWVTAEKLRVLNESCLNASVIPHWKVVRAFLERRTVFRALQDRIGEFPSLSGTDLECMY
ncbi:hypothetical protein NCS56_00143200 [Fusarium sp. Ph1]|nr:hypothetical protein NCS56_00143200 [Fusarium sp. Ph1]